VSLAATLTVVVEAATAQSRPDGVPLSRCCGAYVTALALDLVGRPRKDFDEMCRQLSMNEDGELSGTVGIVPKDRTMWTACRVTGDGLHCHVQETDEGWRARVCAPLSWAAAVGATRLSVSLENGERTATVTVPVAAE
jgi:hypothetical protein